MASTSFEKNDFQHYPVSSDESGSNQSVCIPIPCIFVVTLERSPTKPEHAVAAPSSEYKKIHGLILVPLGNSLELITFRNSKNTAQLALQVGCGKSSGPF